MISKSIGGALLIDGVPAREIGAMVTRSCQARGGSRNEVAHCTGCRKDFSFDEMALPLKYSKVHLGYKGLCLTCDSIKKKARP